MAYKDTLISELDTIQTLNSASAIQKKAAQEFNEPIKAWNVNGITEANYYQIRTLAQQTFVAPRDYFWPLDETTLIQNPNLVQNPGYQGGNGG